MITRRNKKPRRRKHWRYTETCSGSKEDTNPGVRPPGTLRTKKTSDADLNNGKKLPKNWKKKWSEE